jgi:hypothetical protein
VSRRLTGQAGAARGWGGPAIGTRLPITVLRKGALLDVVAVPAELGIDA